MPGPKVVIVGAGPAGLMAAEVLARGGARVVVHERMPSPARRLLMAGRGGLNLTHSEALARLFTQPYPADHLPRVVAGFPLSVTTKQPIRQRSYSGTT